LTTYVKAEAVDMDVGVLAMMAEAEALGEEQGRRKTAPQPGMVERWRKYRRFILMNASIRGPFMPHWSGQCWSEVYLRKVTEEVKVR
jgi:hypothetical protein